MFSIESVLHNSKTWKPTNGWNISLTAEERISLTNIYLFLKKKGYDTKKAEILAEMTTFKQKYIGLKYTKEQEDELENAMKPIYN